MAAPHVTGTAALVASYVPGMAGDPIALKARILGSAKPDAATAGSTVTGRIVDVYRALDRVPPSAKAPTVGFLVGSTMGASTAAVVRALGRHRRSIGVGAYGLQARTGSGAWATALASTGGAEREPEPAPVAGPTASASGPATAPATGVPGRPRRPSTPVRYQETTLAGHLARDVASIRPRARRRAGPAATPPRRARPSRSGSPAGPSRIVSPKGPTRGSAEAVRRWRLRLDRQPAPIELRRRGSSSRHGRGRRRERTRVRAGRARDARPPPGRHRRLRGPALTLSCRGRSSSNTAPAAAGRGSSARCR